VVVPCVARQNDDAAWRIGRQFVDVELFTEPDVKDARYDRVNSVLRMSMRCKLYARRQFDPDHIRARLRRLTDNDGEARGRWKRRKRLPLNILGQDRSEDGLIGLMRSIHVDVLLYSQAFLRAVHPGAFNNAESMGIFLSLTPVAAKIAFATAGTMQDVPVSPMPPGGSALFAIWTSICGISLMRSI